MDVQINSILRLLKGLYFISQFCCYDMQSLNLRHLFNSYHMVMAVNHLLQLCHMCLLILELRIFPISNTILLQQREMSEQISVKHIGFKNTYSNVIPIHISLSKISHLDNIMELWTTLPNILQVTGKRKEWVRLLQRVGDNNMIFNT